MKKGNFNFLSNVLFLFYKNKSELNLRKREHLLNRGRVHTGVSCHFCFSHIKRTLTLLSLSPSALPEGRRLPPRSCRLGQSPR